MLEDACLRSILLPLTEFYTIKLHTSQYLVSIADMRLIKSMDQK